MNHNADSNTGSIDNGNGRMKLSLISGTETWFDVDDITIHIWASNWTGREIVTVRNGGEPRVVSDIRSFRFVNRHEFEHKGHRYRLNFTLGFSRVKVELFRDGQLIDTDLIDNSGIRINPETGRLDWGFLIGKLVLPVLAGLALGVIVGYTFGSVL